MHVVLEKKKITLNYKVILFFIICFDNINEDIEMFDTYA